jgi:hypothetical protein
VSAVRQAGPADSNSVVASGGVDGTPLRMHTHWAHVEPGAAAMPLPPNTIGWLLLRTIAGFASAVVLSSPSTRCWITCRHICRDGALAASASALRCPVPSPC